MIFLLLFLAFVGLWLVINYLINKWTPLSTTVMNMMKRDSQENTPQALADMLLESSPTPASLGNSLEIQNLLKNYPSGGSSITAVDIPKLSIKKGEFMAIMGRSGSGKSTLLNLLGGLDKPTSGIVFLDGENLAAVKSKQLNLIRNRKIGFVFQDFNLIPTLTAQENVALPLKYTYEDPILREKRALKALDSVGLKNRRNHFPDQLSGGECQRVTIARALVNNPTVVLADEPTGEVDNQTSEEIINLMKDLNKKFGTTFIIVTHDPVVAKATNRVLTLQDGRITADKRVIRANFSETTTDDELV